MNTRKFHLPGEAALLIVLLINPLAIDLMSKSVFGISTISSVPLILSTAFPVFSFGTWNYIFQTLLVITLMVLKRSFCPGYSIIFTAPLSPPARIIPGILISESLCTGFYRIQSGGSIDSRPGGKTGTGACEGTGNRIE